MPIAAPIPIPRKQVVIVALFILSIGQNKILQNANDPDLHIKTDT